MWRGPVWGFTNWLVCDAGANFFLSPTSVIFCACHGGTACAGPRRSRALAAGFVGALLCCAAADVAAGDASYVRHIPRFTCACDACADQVRLVRLSGIYEARLLSHVTALVGTFAPPSLTRCFSTTTRSRAKATAQKDLECLLLSATGCSACNSEECLRLVLRRRLRWRHMPVL
jgi:hypothetical protein